MVGERWRMECFWGLLSFLFLSSLSLSHIFLSFLLSSLSFSFSLCLSSCMLLLGWYGARCHAVWGDDEEADALWYARLYVSPRNLSFLYFSLSLILSNTHALLLSIYFSLYPYDASLCMYEDVYVYLSIYLYGYLLDRERLVSSPLNKARQPR